MKTEILTIGDEILIGQIVDTNSSWIAARLMEENMAVSRMISLSDNRQEMLSIIDQSFNRSDVIIVTGGLGPTKDDLTKAVLAEYFESGWRWDTEALEMLEQLFRNRNRELKDINKKQAYLPDNCQTIPNKWGTAPGMLFEKNGKILVSLPGVPFEMKNMMEQSVIPALKKRYSPPPVLVHHFLTVNIPESLLAERLAFVEDVLPENMKLAYLPNLNLVRLRLTCQTSDKTNDNALFENFAAQIRTELGAALATEQNISLEAHIFDLLQQQGKTLALAESCTGGLVSHRLTQLAGISSVYKGGVVSYSNESKVKLLQVPVELLKTHGAVSEEVAKAMAEGCRKNLNADYALSITGIAGPGGGSASKPTGTVYIGLCDSEGVFSQKFFFPRQRSQIMECTFVAALDLLRQRLGNV